MNDDIFFEIFNESDKVIIKNYFKELDDSINLSKSETKLFNDDFKKAILYFYKKKVKITDIIKKLSIENIKDVYKETNNDWYPLDSSAKIYPLSMKENWMSVFRLSYYLKEKVVPEIFQIALLFTIKRFPTFKTSIRRGFFWHYIEEIKKRFHVYEDKMLPCSYINVSNIGKQSFKAVYYKNRISVEYFHILTDGYGGIVFLSTLVATYLRLLGNDISYNDIVLNINNEPDKEEIKDEFKGKKTNTKEKSLIENKALQVDGKLSSIKPCQIIHYDINVNDLKSLAKEYNATITELILTYIFISLSHSTSGNGNIKVQVPINMRKYYPSKTIRNFSLYMTININRNDITSFDKTLKEIKKQMKEKNNLAYLNGIMKYVNKLVSSIKFIPMFIKKPIASIVYGYAGDKSLTSVLSNLGNVSIPEDMKKYIEKMDFVLGTAITNRVLFSMITVNDILTLTISKSTTNSSVENNLYNLFKQNGIDVNVHGSELYENRK